MGVLAYCPAQTKSYCLRPTPPGHYAGCLDGPEAGALRDGPSRPFPNTATIRHRGSISDATRRLGKTTEPDPGAVRLAELRAQLNKVGSKLRGLEPGSPEQLEELERLDPIHAAVVALAEELGQ